MAKITTLINTFIYFIILVNLENTENNFKVYKGDLSECKVVESKTLSTKGFEIEETIAKMTDIFSEKTIIKKTRTI